MVYLIVGETIDVRGAGTYWKSRSLEDIGWMKLARALPVRPLGTTLTFGARRRPCPTLTDHAM